MSILLLGGTLYAKDPATPIVVQLYNAAGMSPEDLDRFKTETSRLFSVADFDIRWEDRRPHPDDFAVLDDPVKSVLAQTTACPAEPYFTVTVQITDRLSRSFRPKAVGFALPFAHAGVRVTIFYDRVERISRNAGAPLSRVLAAMLSHELGHVLIGTDGHGDSIMRPEWDSGNFQTLGRPLPPIAASDVGLMHRHVNEWERATAACRDNFDVSVAAGE